LRILFVASECAPLVKIGGLADVVGSLPKALAELGHDVRIILPLYDAIDRAKLSARPTTHVARVNFSGTPELVRLFEAVVPGSSIPVYLVDWPGQFAQEVYPLGQDHATIELTVARFARFSLAVSQLLSVMPWKPDVLHCHDWHTALIPVLVHGPAAPATFLTIHNLDIQGKWDPVEFGHWLDINPDHAPWNHRDRDGNLNFLQLGIHHADQVTTVSPTYARESVRPEFGEGLDRDLAQHHIIGILNGIDDHAYDPAHDPALVSNYDLSNFVEGKSANKAALQRELGLPVEPDAPLFVNIGRLVPQKGVDLLLPLFDQVAATGAQLAFLGSGFPEIEAVLRRADLQVPAVAAKFGFNSSLGRRLYAGGDFFVMPSRFEPCGLGQMIAMRYGTIPVVHDTGGLHDTVPDLNHDPANGLGFSFTDAASSSIWAAMQRAIELYRDRPSLISAIQRSMRIDHSWYTSAQAYAQIYKKIIAPAKGQEAGDQDGLRPRSAGDNRPRSRQSAPQLRF
jgi:starch synthase